MPSKLCQFYLHCLLASLKRHFQSTSRLQLSCRKHTDPKQGLWTLYKIWSHVQNPPSQPPTTSAIHGLCRYLCFWCVLEASFPGPPKALQFDAVANLSLILLEVQERSQSSWGERDPAGQQVAGCRSLLCPAYRLPSETLFSYLSMKSNWVKWTIEHSYWSPSLLFFQMNSQPTAWCIFPAQSNLNFLQC